MATVNKYKELSKVKVTDARNVIISEYSKGGFTLAQQLEVEEAGKKVSVFMNGAIHIDNVEGLYKIRDAVNVAIKKIEDEIANDHLWDD